MIDAGGVSASSTDIIGDLTDNSLKRIKQITLRKLNRRPPDTCTRTSFATGIGGAAPPSSRGAA